jgi:uncharacterized membrane protein YcaP (DUF421 family)
MESSTFFSGWSGVWRVLVVGALAYLTLVLWLRISGKRTVAKWNAFDLVITVSLGSTLATIMLSKSVALVEGVVGLGLLVAMQFAITWLSVRLRWVRKLTKSEPTLLLDHGRICHEALREQRVTESELRAAVRSKGIAALEDVEAVVLETDGNFSVIKRSGSGSRSALEDVPRIDSSGSQTR